MKEQKNEVRTEAGRMVSHYAPQFHAHGVLLDFHLRHFKEYYPDTRTSRQRAFDDIGSTVARCFRRLFAGKKEPKEQAEGLGVTVKSWSLILNFQVADNKKLSKDYAFVYRQKDRSGQSNIATERVLRAAERVINRKLRQLQKQDAQALCTDTWWDVARYVFGNYGYKKTAKGLDLSLLKLVLVVIVIILISLLCLI